MQSSEVKPYAAINSVAVIGNYAPRQCGIATFTTDLVRALSGETANNACWAVAINDRPQGYPYSDKVHFEIDKKQLSDYRLAADFLNINQADVVCLQHEYGIFGGLAGSHILKLLTRLRMPVVTTLHTVLTEPGEEQHAVMLQLAELSDRLVVMTHKAVDILQSVYSIDPARIVCIPHGIPDMPFVDPNYYKDQFGLLEKKVILTFGLLSQNKGVEYALQALPKVVERFPDLLYIVLGATHPEVLRAGGESYRLQLSQQVRKLKLERHVMFQNRFVTLAELCKYLAAADIYITPYINEAQITSGTLAYAMGTGKPVISTPYWYAAEMLAEGRGRLVPFRHSEAISEALIELLENDVERHTIRKRAYDFSRDAVWDEVARAYLQVFREVKCERARHPRSYQPSPRPLAENPFGQELPELKLDHLLAMTDDTGLLQHAKYTIPERSHGYCTDDNARALIVAAQAWRLAPEQPQQLSQLCDRYLAFLLYAFDFEGSGRFRNFMGYDRRWLELVGSEDSHGRALWGLGSAVSLLNDSRQLPLAATLFKQALPATEGFAPLRAIAFALIGIHAYLETFSGDSHVRRTCTILAERLFEPFAARATAGWPWPEHMATYDNAKLPHALLLCGRALQRSDMLEAALRSLEWLVQVQSEDGHFVPVGNYGWYPRDGSKARFDQQPLEAHATTDACIAAFRLTRDKIWLKRATLAFNWFLGHNDLNLSLYDAKTGGCSDGLQSDSVNLNQGAESTLSWLLSLAALHRLSAEEILLTQASRRVAVSAGG